MRPAVSLAAVVALIGVACVPASAAGADPLLAAAGDIACSPSQTAVNSSPDQCQQSATGALIKSNGPTAVATLGDNQYRLGTYAEFTGSGAFGDTWGTDFGSIILPAPGNHEYAQSSTADGYFQYFGGAATDGGPAGSPAPGYYSYNLGVWHIISLNSNCVDTTGCQNYSGTDGGTTRTEVQWLQSDLQAHPGQCTLAYWHHPLFSSDVGSASPGVKGLWDALYARHADIVLNGHAHDYERFAPQDPTGTAKPSGIAEFIVGTGGYSLGAFNPTPMANSQFRYAADFGALFLSLHQRSYDWKFTTTSGASMDLGTAQCHPLPPPAPVISRPADGSHYNAGNVTLSGSAEANSTLEVFDGGVSQRTTAVDPGGTWSVSLTGVPNGSHSYTAVATDMAGVTGPASTAVHVVVDRPPAPAPAPAPASTPAPPTPPAPAPSAPARAAATPASPVTPVPGTGPSSELPAGSFSFTGSPLRAPGPALFLDPGVIGRCNSASACTLTGEASTRIRTSGSAAGVRTMVLGRLTFALRAGSQSRIKIRLSRPALLLLRRAGRVRVVITARVVSPHHALVRGSRVIVLLWPKGKQGLGTQ